MPFVKEIAAHLKGKCPKDLKDKLGEAFTEKGVGMVINERLINIPQETAPPLVDGLFDEIGWATEDEPTQELRDSFKFSKYLFFTRLFRDDEPEQNEENKKRKRSDEPLLMYIRPEDEFFHQLAEWRLWCWANCPCGFEKDKKGEGFLSKRVAAMKLTTDG